MFDWVVGNPSAGQYIGRRPLPELLAVYLKQQGVLPLRISALLIRCRMLVRGEDRSCNEPGVRVLVLTETLDAEDRVSKAFATHESSHAASALAEYLDAVPQGRTVSWKAYECKFESFRSTCR